jgi:hypothetical protein
VGSIPVANPAPQRRIRFSRRGATILLALLASAAVIAVLVAFSLPKNPSQPQYEWLSLASVDDLPINEPVAFKEHRLYLVRFETDEVIALSRQDPKGCTIPWRPDFVFQGKKGWFRDPCYSSTYSFAGDIAFGPSPRSMDRYPLAIVDGEVVVDVRNRLCAPGYAYVPEPGYRGPEPPLVTDCLSQDQYRGQPPTQ